MMIYGSSAGKLQLIWFLSAIMAVITKKANRTSTRFSCFINIDFKDYSSFLDDLEKDIDEIEQEFPNDHKIAPFLQNLACDTGKLKFCIYAENYLSKIGLYEAFLKYLKETCHLTTDPSNLTNKTEISKFLYSVALTIQKYINSQIIQGFPGLYQENLYKYDSVKAEELKKVFENEMIFLKETLNKDIAYLKSIIRLQEPNFDPDTEDPHFEGMKVFEAWITYITKVLKRLFSLILDNLD